jgi:hypothetical protein
MSVMLSGIGCATPQRGRLAGPREADNDLPGRQGREAGRQADARPYGVVYATALRFGRGQRDDRAAGWGRNPAGCALPPAAARASRRQAEGSRELVWRASHPLAPPEKNETLLIFRLSYAASIHALFYIMQGRTLAPC